MLNTVGVVGLGLIGGSLARELAARGVRVLAADRDAGALRAAQAEGIVAAPLPQRPDAGWPLDLLVLALPVGAAPAALEAALPRLPPHCVVTDVGSTKASIGAAARRLGAADRFAGSHPLAGGHRSGWAAARQGLFRGARVYVCPAGAEPAAVRRVHQLWEAVGARVVEVDAREHDERLAWTSHLPQLLASSLGRALAGQGIAREELGPGGRDMTRLAGSSPEMWSAIACDNAEPIGAALDALRARLDELAAALRSRDEAALRRLLADAQGWFDEAERA